MSTYLDQVADVVVLEHLPGVRAVPDVLEGLCGVDTRVLDENLLASRMLSNESGKMGV